MNISEVKKKPIKNQDILIYQRHLCLSLSLLSFFLCLIFLICLSVSIAIICCLLSLLNLSNKSLSFLSLYHQAITLLSLSVCLFSTYVFPFLFHKNVVFLERIDDQLNKKKYKILEFKHRISISHNGLGNS